MTDEEIKTIFDGAGDFVRRELICCGMKIYAYAIDGLISSADAAKSIFLPIAMTLKGDTMEQLYIGALNGTIYNTVAVACVDTEDIALKLVNVQSSQVTTIDCCKVVT